MYSYTLYDKRWVKANFSHCLICFVFKGHGFDTVQLQNTSEEEIMWMIYL